MGFGDYKYVADPKDFPQGEHYVILEFGSHLSPGYDKDDDYSVPDVHYIAFTSREAWEADINRRLNEKSFYPKAFKAIVVKPATIKTHVEVTP